MRALLQAGHPEPSLAVTAATCGLAAGAGRPAAGVVWVGAAVLAGQLSIGWGNDWLDHARDRAAGRTGKPAATGKVAPATVRAAALAALAACVPLSLASGAAATGVHLVGVGAGWAYNLGLKTTAASVVPYALAFALIPVFVWWGLDGRPAPPWWAVVAACLIGAGAHFTQTLPDLDADERTGVRGLPQRLGPRRSLLAAAGLIGAGAVAVTAGVGVGDLPTSLAAGASLLLVAGILAAGLAGRARLAFHLTVAAGLATAVTLLLGARGA